MISEELKILEEVAEHKMCAEGVELRQRVVESDTVSLFNNKGV